MASFLREFQLAFEVVNIEEDRDIEAAFGGIIPVLKRGEVEIARVPQSSRTFRRALQRAGVL